MDDMDVTDPAPKERTARPVDACRDCWVPAALEAAADSSSRAAIVVDETTGTVAAANAAAALIAGLTRDEIVGHPAETIGIPVLREDDECRAFPWHLPAGHHQAIVDVDLVRLPTPHGPYRLERYLDHTPDAGAAERSDLNDILVARIQELGAVHANLARAWQRNQSAREQERRKLAVSLHDDTIQRIAAASWHLEDLNPAAEDAGAQLDAVRGELGEAVDSIRAIIADLYPAHIDTYGLPGAIERQAGEILDPAITVTVERTGLREAPAPDTAALLYRIAVQSLRNVALHAHASTVHIALHRTASAMTLDIVDNGRGYRPADIRQQRLKGHIGVDSMREEAELAGGTFTIGNRGDGARGTHVRCTLPTESAT